MTINNTNNNEQKSSVIKPRLENKKQINNF
jgi:hypothetical protein